MDQITTGTSPKAPHTIIAALVCEHSLNNKVVHAQTQATQVTIIELSLSRP